MAKLMIITGNDDYRAMVIFKTLLLMGIDRVPLDKAVPDVTTRFPKAEKEQSEVPQCR